MADILQIHQDTIITPERLLNIGIEKFEDGLYSEAIECFQDAISADIDQPELVQVYFFKGKAELKLSNYVTAIEDLTHALSFNELSNEDKASAELHRGLSRFKLAQYSEAIADVNAAIASGNLTQIEQAIAFYTRGVCHYKQYNHAQASNDLLAAIDSGALPAIINQDAVFYRALALKELGDFAGSLQLLTQVIDSATLPEEALMEAFYIRGFLRLESGNHQHAEEDFDKVIASSETFEEFLPSAYLYRGQARMELAKVELAYNDLTTALASRLPPKHQTRALLSLGIANIQRRDYIQAEKILSGVLQHPDLDTLTQAKALFHRAVAKMNVGFNPAAYDDFNNALAVNKSPGRRALPEDLVSKAQLYQAQLTGAKKAIEKPVDTQTVISTSTIVRLLATSSTSGIKQSGQGLSTAFKKLTI